LSTLSSFGGTYRQINSKVAVWIHEGASYQNASSYLRYNSYDECQMQGFEMKCSTKYGFELIYLPSGTLYAACDMNTEYYFNQSVRPDLCSEWKVIQQMGPQDIYEVDSTFTVAAKICSQSTSTGNFTATICMEQTIDLNETLYSMFNYVWGDFVLKENASYNNEPIYYNPRLSNTEYSLYILYSATDDYWMLTNYVPTQSDTSISDYIALCSEFDVAAPYQCTGCWQFSSQQMIDIPCVVTVFQGNCSRSYNASDEYPTDLCVAISTSTDQNGQGPITGLVTETIANYELVDEIMNGRLFWKYDSEHYIYYSSIMRSWVLYANMTEYYCDEYGTNDITNCEWDSPAIQIFFSCENISIGTTISIASTVGAFGKDTAATNTKVVVGVVIAVVILFVIVALAVVYYLKKTKKQTAYAEFDRNDVVDVQMESNQATVTPGINEGNQTGVKENVSDKKTPGQNASSENGNDVWTRYDE